MAAMSSGQQRYELVTTVGKGGMAEVFLGWMHSVGGLRRRVAIKRILPELTSKQSQLFEQMFVDEARLAFQLEHDNIVRVYDVGQSADTFFIVMEYVEGMDLKAIYNKLVERGEQMPLGDCLYLSQQIAAGLSYAHTLTDEHGKPLNLVHNDISPPNVLCGRYGEVKIADFGLSDAVSNDVETPEGMVKGKFAYISPESTRDPNLVSLRSDVFSAGIVMWELLAGRRLFQRGNDLDTFKAVQACEVPDVRTVRADCPEPFAKIVAQALAKNPDHRFQSCAELFNALTRASYVSNIPLSRLSLAQLIGRLKGESWGFEGQKLEGAEAQNLMAALTSIVPAGVADHLSSFVTNARVADDSEALENSSMFAVDWIGDVIDDAGLSGDLAGLPMATGQEHAIPEGNVAQANNAFDPTPVPAPTPASAPAPQAKAPPQEPIESPEAVVARIRSEYSRQRNVFVAIATVMGMLIGVAAGIGISLVIS